MLGAIIGDIVGSRFEFSNYLDTDFDLFTGESSFTDDTICTIAVADALLNDLDFGESLRRWCGKYPQPKGGYGCSFLKWFNSKEAQAYGSFGNGSAMRVSPCAWLFVERSVVIKKAKASAECTHNHEEGIKGAMAIADCIWSALHGYDKTVIRKIAENYGYLLKTCDKIRSSNSFNETCQVTVPQAISAFLESDDFESAIRLAVSIGGDSDTIAAMTGGIAEAYYGIPEQIKQRSLMYLPQEFIAVISSFTEKAVKVAKERWNVGIDG